MFHIGTLGRWFTLKGEAGVSYEGQREGSMTKGREQRAEGRAD